MARQQDQVWQGDVDGRAHRVEAGGSSIHRVRWLVDGEEVARKTDLSEKIRLRDDDHGRLTVRFSAMGSPRRATLHGGETDLDGTDLEPEPGSPAARWEQRLVDHPARHTLLEGLGSAGGIVAGLLAAAAFAVVARFVLRLLPDVSLPSIPFPDLPSIPWPDLPSIPWPDLPSIPFPDLPDLPDLPGWTRYVVTVLVAMAVAMWEVRRRRRQDERRRAALRARGGDDDPEGSGSVEP